MALSKLAIGLIATAVGVGAVGATTAAVVVTRNNNQNTASVDSNTEVSINDKGEVNANSNTSANADPDKELARVFDAGSQEVKKSEEELKETEVKAKGEASAQTAEESHDSKRNGDKATVEDKETQNQAEQPQGDGVAQVVSNAELQAPAVMSQDKGSSAAGKEQPKVEADMNPVIPGSTGQDSDDEQQQK